MTNAGLRPPTMLIRVVGQIGLVYLLLASILTVHAFAEISEGVQEEKKHLVEALIRGTGSDWPCSFVFGGKPSAELLPHWEESSQTTELAEDRVQYQRIWRDPATGLQVRLEAVEYHDFPVIEWTLFFANKGKENTPILEEVLPLNWRLKVPSDVAPILYYHLGSQASATDYAPQETPLEAGQSRRFAPVGGRPSNGIWPYFNLAMGKRGVIVVIGWPGQWMAEFARPEHAQLSLRAGQELLRTKLLPGEEIRTPLVVLLFWEGDRWKAQNLWRRWMMAHSMPRPSGKLPRPMFLASSSRAYEEMIRANEENQKMHIDRYLEERLKIDYWWMDAGWYIQEHGWPQVGTWEVDPRRFPRGLRAISDYAHTRGVKILVWFEPERVMPGTWLYEHHPEWLLKPSSQPDPLEGLQGWKASELGRSEPSVTFNSAREERRFANIVWEPKTFSFHPGGRGEYCVVRFRSEESGRHQLDAVFRGLDRSPTTTEVFVIVKGEILFRAGINLAGGENQARYQGDIILAAGDSLDFVVGWGNGSHICDTTGLEVTVSTPSGKVHRLSEEFDPVKNPSGCWSYGWLPPGELPDVGQFRLLDRPTRPGAGPRLLDLGNPQAWEWLVNKIDTLIVQQGIDLYRQDFNIDPLPFWRSADSADRQGITENKYVVGFLAFWDELRRRHPEMLIDSCASGGRRNDLETMRRAVPLWRSDYAYEPIGHQCMTYGISLWLPFHGTGTVAYAAAPYYGSGPTPVEPYAFWSNAAPSLVCGVDIRVRDLDYDSLRRLIGHWREFSQFYYGDFYPLTPFSVSPADWIGWQFHDPEKNAGAVQLFRRQECQEEVYRLKLRELDPQAVYTITVFEGEMPKEALGQELMEQGLPVRIPSKPGVAVFLYHRR